MKSPQPSSRLGHRSPVGTANVTDLTRPTHYDKMMRNGIAGQMEAEMGGAFDKDRPPRFRASRAIFPPVSILRPPDVLPAEALMKFANHIPKPHSSPFKGSLGAISHAWLACSLLAAALSLGGCLSDAEQARLEVDLVPLKASYKPGDTIWVEGQVLTDDQLDISLMAGHSSPAGLQYLTNGTEETFKDTVDLRRDFGRGYYVTPEACSGDLEFTVHLRAGIENTKHMKKFPLRTRIEGKDCGAAG